MKSVYEEPYKFCPKCKTPLKRKPIDNKKLLACPDCHFVFWNNPKPVVSVILYHQGKILMLQRAKEPLKNYWCLPGGIIDYEESPKEAILREIMEEAGVNTKIKSLVGVYRIDNDPRGVTIDIVYEANISGQVSLSEEHCQYAFYDPQALPKKIAYKHRQAINDWLKTRRKYD